MPSEIPYFRAVSRVVDASGPGGATVRGIHAEGPIIATRGGLPDSAGHCAVSKEEAELEPELNPLTKFERLIDESLGKNLKVQCNYEHPKFKT